jgi:hypothetical protein
MMGDGPDGIQFSRYAREIDFRFHPPIRSGSVVENVLKSLGDVVEALQAGGCDFIGHLKVFLETENEGGYFFSLTSSDKPPDHKGRMPEKVSGVKMTINAILGGLSEAMIEEKVRWTLEKGLTGCGKTL